MLPSIKYQLITNEDQQEASQQIFDKGLKIILSCVLLFVLLLYKYPFDISFNVVKVGTNFEENETHILVKGIQQYSIKSNRMSSTATEIQATTEKSIINGIKTPKYSNTHTITAIPQLQTTQSSVISNIETSTKSVSTTTTSKDIVQTTQSLVIRTFKANTRNPYADNNKTLERSSESFDDVLNSTHFEMVFGNISEVMPSFTVAPPTTAALVPKKYYVYTSTCQMPYIDHHQKDVMKIYRPKPYKKCTKDKDLVSSSFDNAKRRYSLHINGNPADIHCCYQNIIRAGLGNSADKTFKALPCVSFHQDFVVPEHIDALIVKCTHKRSAKLTQLNGFSFIQKRNSTSSGEVKNSTQTNIRSPNVLMVGIDSLSRMNFLRTMPLTHQYLSNNKLFFELEGYNKMGDNTFPNLMALLTGYNNEHAYHECNPKVAGGLDKCTFLWNNYKKNGYHTAYAEDWVQFSTFNYLKKGFQKQPTEHYMRPLVLAMERLLKVKLESKIPYCVGQKHSAEYIYDYAMQFDNFYRDEKYFGFFWTNSFSHNDFSLPSSMDSRMLKYFKDMENSGVLENTIVVFFSDHGMRFGALRKLQNGFYEERWPMFYISLPKWFQNEHSDFVKALRINKNRLTSPYDIHVTMNHILKLSQPEYKYPQPQGCPKCQSIFYEVPENRTCDDAGITEHWCTCSSYTNVSTNDTQVLEVSKLMVDKINQYLAAKDFGSKCAKLKLGAIINATQKLDLNDSLDLSYRLKLEAQPKSALFEATVYYDPKNKHITLDVELVSRLNSYEKVSHCIDDKTAMKYCICA